MDRNDSNMKRWLGGIAYEVAFWNNVCRWKHTFEGMMGWSNYGATIKLDMFDANDYLSAIKNPKVLDVGCGMSFATGNKYGNPEKMLDIHYVDPLATYFNEIIKRYKRNLPEIEFGMMEYLSAFYTDHDVDLVIIQNALDHSSHPFKGIIEALEVLKIGGMLYLNHHPNEAEMEHYKGFHQYNIEQKDGLMYIWNMEQRICVNKEIEAFADMDVCTQEGGFIVATLRKKAEVPANLLNYKTDRRELCEELLMCRKESAKISTALAYKLNYWKYNTIQFLAQALPWNMKMALKKMIKQA